MRTLLLPTGFIPLFLIGFLAQAAPVQAGGKTPEEAFAALVEAAKKEDMKALLGTLSKDSQKVFTGSMVGMGVGIKQVAKFLGSDPAEIGKVLTDHGVKEEEVIAEMKALQGGAEKPKPESIVDMLRKTGDKIKDAPGFSTAVMKALKSLDKKGMDDPIRELREAKLKGEIKKDKDAATAEVVLGGMTKEIHFVQEDGAWKVNLVPMILNELKKGL